MTCITRKERQTNGSLFEKTASEKYRLFEQIQRYFFWSNLLLSLHHVRPRAFKYKIKRALVFSIVY